MKRKTIMIVSVVITIVALMNYRAYIYQVEEFALYEVQKIEEDFKEVLERENQPMMLMVRPDTIHIEKQVEKSTQAPLEEEIVTASAPAGAVIGVEYILDWLAGLINSICGAIGAFFGYRSLRLKKKETK